MSQIGYVCLPVLLNYILKEIPPFHDVLVQPPGSSPKQLMKLWPKVNCDNLMQASHLLYISKLRYPDNYEKCNVIMFVVSV